MSSSGRYTTDRDRKRTIKNYKTLLIYDFLSDHAIWKSQHTVLFKKKYPVDLSFGQYISSAELIAAAVKKETELDLKKAGVQREIAKLEELGLIIKESAFHGTSTKPIGTIYTVLDLAEFYAKISASDPIRALEPQEIQKIADPIKALSDPIIDPIIDPIRALEPQGFQRFGDPITDPIIDPTIIKNKELKEKELKEKDLKDLNKQHKISESQSIVNTFSTAFNFILTRFENEFLRDKKEASLTQINAIREFTQKMELDLLTALLQEAGEGARSNPAKYFLEICRENLRKGITTLDKKLQSAALYTQQAERKNYGNKKDPKDFATRRGLTVSESYYDDVPF